MVSRLGLTSRILLASSFVILVLALMRLGINWFFIEDQVLREILLQSRAVTQQAHIVLKQSSQIHAQHMETFGERGQINSQNITKSKSLSSGVIPIHFAQKVAQQGLDSEQHDFLVFRENILNQAGFTDLALLNQLRENELNELFEIDEKQNVVRYVSPIRVGKECLVCHGDRKSGAGSIRYIKK